MEGVQEIIGRSGVCAVLRITPNDETSPSLEQLCADMAPDGAVSVMSALDDLYGVRGGRGVALRAGRASFKYLLHTFGEKIELTSMNFRLQPTRLRLKAGLNKLSELLSKEWGSQIKLSEDARYWYWRVQDCPECKETDSDHVMCHFTTGLLQEYLSWAGGGKFYTVAETECCARGAEACIFRVDPVPLD
jgi:predicted hydrocarbon binding protein